MHFYTPNLTLKDLRFYFKLLPEIFQCNSKGHVINEYDINNYSLGYLGSTDTLYSFIVFLSIPLSLPFFLIVFASLRQGLIQPRVVLTMLCSQK